MVIFFAIVLLLVFISLFLRIEIDYHSQPRGGASHTAGPICTPPHIRDPSPKNITLKPALTYSSKNITEGGGSYKGYPLSYINICKKIFYKNRVVFWFMALFGIIQIINAEIVG